MKTLRFIGTALLAVVLCVNFAACSNDDDDDNGGGGNQSQVTTSVLKGTTWKTLSDTGETFDAGFLIVFGANGTVTTVPDSGFRMTYTVEKNNTLKISFPDFGGNTYVTGVFSIQGKSATYKYTSHGELDGNGSGTMTFEKQ